MTAQQKAGHRITLLYPGGISWKYPRMQIKEKTPYCGINVFELKNPYPVSLLHGVKKPQCMYQDKWYDDTIFIAFLKLIKPDIIHIHTLMGLPKRFLNIAKEQGVKLVYTSHDYYGLCLKTNFIDYQNKLCDTAESAKCRLCNMNAPSTTFLRLRNEPAILKIKKTLNVLRFNKNRILNKEIVYTINSNKDNEHVYYNNLLNYYSSFFRLFYKIHFNSTIAENVFKKNISITNSIVIPVTHAGIKDNRKRKTFPIDLRIGFIGNLTTYKGFPLLKRILTTKFSNKKQKWNLSVWGGSVGIDSECPDIYYKGKFDDSSINNVYDEMDVLIVPSIWKETFSLITLEALSYGVPVIVSDNVGAKDLVSIYNSEFIYRTELELEKLLNKILINRSSLINFNSEILNKEWSHSIEKHIEVLNSKLYK